MIAAPRPHWILLFALCAVAGPSGVRAQAAAPEKDRHLPGGLDPSALETARYNFGEVFTYSLRPDSTVYGTVQQFRDLYPDSHWEALRKGLTNEDGTLAWKASRDMMAFVTLYDATADPWFLEWLGRLAEAAMASRDDFQKKRDFQNKLNPGWGSSAYGDKSRKVYLVHSALIVQPLLEWALRISALPSPTPDQLRRRDWMVEKCRETLLWHDYQIVADPPAGEMLYDAGNEEPDRERKWQPYNRQILMARNFYLLRKLTGEETYNDRSQKLYRFFKNRLERTPSDAYVWEYEPFKGVPVVKVASCDDVSHASFTLEAVIPACEEGIVFDRADLDRFARTFTRYVHLGGGAFQSKIGCVQTFSPRYMDRLYAWIPLAKADPKIYGLLRKFLMGNVEKPPPQAIAYLVAFRPAGRAGIDTRAR